MNINPLMQYLWFSFFIGWAIKKLTIKYGGQASFQVVRQLMSGGRHAGSDVPIELLYGTRDRAHCVALRGKPHVFTVFAKQQRNFIVAGLRWRFRPKDERNTLAAPVALLGSNIVGSDGYVSDDHTQPEATFSFAEMSTGPTVWIGDDRWGGEDCPLPVDTPLVVRVGTVAIGYRASGPCGQRLA